VIRSRLFANQRAVRPVYDPDTFNLVAAAPAACRCYGCQPGQLAALQVTDLNGMTLEQAAAWRQVPTGA
jgi:hypothetical protein